MIAHVQRLLGGYQLVPRDGHDGSSALSSRHIRRFLVLAIVGSLGLFGVLAFFNSNVWSPNYSQQQQQQQQQTDVVTTAPVNPDVAEKHLVIASFTKQDVAWLKDIPSSWTIKRYFMDDTNPPDGGLTVPKNQGREAMAYLTYVIDHYDNLPDYIVFTHGHNRSWHQIEPLPMKIRALNLTALSEENYISLRCGDQMGCERQPYIDTQKPNWDGEKHLRDFWHSILPRVQQPKYLSYKCCAQHAVTRKAVRTRTKAEWESIREPLMRGVENYSWGKEVDNWLLGTFYEKYWHVWFGAGEEYCPSISLCQQRFFSNAIICDGDIDRTLFEGETWQQVRCISAFDDLPKDASPKQVAKAIAAFQKDILGSYARIRGAASERLAEALKAFEKHGPVEKEEDKKVDGQT